VTVVETHDIILETTGRSTSRPFGLGADQAIRLMALTRIGPDAEPHRLKAVDTVAGPDEYRYYDRGHVYFSIPPLGEQVAVQYRFEYELAGAVTPAWAIAAGPARALPDEQELFWPWKRIGHVVADWRAPGRRLTTRYRFDHDVLLPSREGPATRFADRLSPRVRHAWRDIAPPGTSARRRTARIARTRCSTISGPGTRRRRRRRRRCGSSSLAALPIAGTSAGCSWSSPRACAAGRRSIAPSSTRAS
jgi:hypothetical protein